jgi:TetR/AcrR family transcriptional repressor of nem operon
VPRPKSFDTGSVIEAVKQAFWDGGYRHTGIAELERRTGLSRSSLYRAFGSKAALFAKAIESYAADSLGPLLDPIEREAPAYASVEKHFALLAEIFRTDEGWSRRGCMIVNALTELAQDTGLVSPIAADFPDRLNRAFARCLEGAGSADASMKAELLTTMNIGLWLTARLDREHAARVCDAVLARIAIWKERETPGF